MRIFSSRTKTTFRRRSSEGRTLRTVLVFAVLALIAAMLFREPLGNATSFAASPLYAARSWFLTSNWAIPVYLRSRAALDRELRDLRATLAAQEGNSIRVAALEHENGALQALLSNTGVHRIAAGVVLAPGATPYDTLLIDRGTEDGVVDGALVFASGDLAIGRVARAFSQSAIVMLFSTPGVRTPVFVFGPDVFASAEGRGGGVVRIGVPQGVPIAAGNTIVMPTLSTGIVGEVAYIEADESNPEQYAFAPLAASAFSLRYVAVDPRPLPTVSYEDAARAVEEARAAFGTSTLPLPEPEATSTSATQ